MFSQLMFYPLLFWNIDILEKKAWLLYVDFGEHHEFTVAYIESLGIIFQKGVKTVGSHIPDEISGYNQ